METKRGRKRLLKRKTDEDNEDVRLDKKGRIGPKRNATESDTPVV